jgi:hypothetical protein
MQKTSVNSHRTVVWQLGKAVQSKTPYHERFFSGNGCALLRDKKNLRWWTITIRLHFDGLLSSTNLRPNCEIFVDELFDVVSLALNECFTDDEISTAINIEAVLVSKSKAIL